MKFKQDKTKATLALHKTLSYELNGDDNVSELTFTLPNWKSYTEEGDKILEECLIKMCKLVERIRKENGYEN